LIKMMPQIWMDNDNADAILLPKSARKAISESAGKKSVLTKLENVILSHKSHPTLLKDSNTKWPKSSICKETPQKQHRQQLQEKSYAGQSIEGGLWKAAELSAANNLNVRSADTNDSLDLFDCIQFPTQKCLRNCQKPISPNWMEPLLSEQLIDKLLNNTLAGDELRVPDIPAYPDLDQDEFALKSLTDKLNESVEKSTEVFEVMLPPVLYDIDFDEEPFKF
ncbi:GH10981, partial [Drosophila grimshawi]